MKRKWRRYEVLPHAPQQTGDRNFSWSFGEMASRDLSAGFRRILYDAMVLSSSLRAIRDCSYYRQWTASDIDGNIEAHQANALIQMRSMVDFLSCQGAIQHDTITVVQFFGCTLQTVAFQKKTAHKYVAHKSWDAVAKDAAAGAVLPTKREIVKNGINVLDAFDRFWQECQTNGLSIRFNPYAKRYLQILQDNVTYLKSKGV